MSTASVASVSSFSSDQGIAALEEKAASSSTSDLAEIRRLANQHLSANQIAERLGKSVSTIIQEAVAAGINLNTSSTNGSSTSTTGNSATSNKVNVTV